MKTTFFSCFWIGCLFFITSEAFSQEAKTLLKEDSLTIKDVGIAISPNIGFTQMGSSSALLFNMRGGVNLKDKVTLGGYYNTSLNEVRLEGSIFSQSYWDYNAVGGFIEFTVLSKNVVHVTFPLFIGYGEVEIDQNDRQWTNPGGKSPESEFIEIEPAAFLEFNLHKFVRFNLGAGYRFTEPLNQIGADQIPDIGGLTGYLGFRVGLFR